MSKIYALVLVSLSDLREDSINSLLFDNTTGYSGNWNLILEKNSIFSNKVNFRVKTYKTFSGALRSANKFTQEKLGKVLRTSAIQDPYTKLWKNTVILDTSKYRLVPIDITETWNKNIDNIIIEKNENHEKEIKRLISKRV